MYQQAFPDLFTPISEADKIIPGITAHFRYPEDLFRVQTTMYGRYHLTNAADFYSQAQAWSVSPDPGSGPAVVEQPASGRRSSAPTASSSPPQVARLAPQYILAHPPGSTQQSFMPLIPFVPVGTATERQNLTAFMTASSDPEQLRHAPTVYETPPGQTVDGPALITNAIRSNPRDLLGADVAQPAGFERGARARWRWCPSTRRCCTSRPVYVESSSNQIPTLKDVVVVYNGKAYHSSNASLDNALCQVINPDGTQPFSSYCNTAEAQGGASW